jgi:thiazole synthase ThiGH ThiG subunit
MSLTKDDKEKIIQAAKKLVQDKKDILAYSNGEITKKQLDERGVKLAMPL